MRLSKKEVSSIKEEIGKRDPEAKIYLFGSRADDSKRGGDIDLLIVSKSLEEENKWEILESLYTRIGEQKIDLLISDESGIKKKPFFRIAYKQGILL